MITVDIELTISALKSADAGTRGAAAEALGQIGNPYAIQPLCDALTDADPTVRQAVLAAIVGFRDAEALCEALKVDDDDIRAAAAQALCELESADAIGVLYDYLLDEYPNVGRGSVPAGVFALAGIAGHCNNQAVRGVAMAALRKIGSSPVLSSLYSVLKVGTPLRRRLAAEALGLMGNPGSVMALCRSLEDPDSSVRQESAKALGAYEYTSAVPALCKALQDEDWWVRRRAAESLGILDDLRAVEPLCAALEDSQVAVRRSAAEALGLIGDPAAVWHLCRAQWVPQTAKVATEALARMGADFTLPLRVLEHSQLSAAEKLDALDAMRQSGFHLGPIDRYCLSIQGREDVTPEASQGAASVLTEFKRRREGMELLRAGERDTAEESAELLRSASGSRAAADAGKLLQASDAPATEQTPQPRSIFGRLFGRR